MVQGHWAKRPMSSIIRGRLNQGREVLKKKRKESTKRPQCAQLTRKQHQQQHCPRAHSEYSLRKQKREIEKEFVTILYLCVLFQTTSQSKQATAAAMSHDGHIKNCLSLSHSFQTINLTPWPCPAAWYCCWWWQWQWMLEKSVTHRHKVVIIIIRAAAAVNTAVKEVL